MDKLYRRLAGISFVYQLLIYICHLMEWMPFVYVFKT